MMTDHEQSANDEARHGNREALERMTEEQDRLREALRWIAEAEISEPNNGNRNDAGEVELLADAIDALRTPAKGDVAEAWETDWGWWAGTGDTWMTVGPCLTRESAIDEMVQDGAAEWLDETQDPPAWVNTFHIVEARQDPLRLADWIGADWILERADEALADSDRVSCENDDGPWFDATKEQEADLEYRLRRTCDEWQAAHSLTFHSTTFSHMRNAETVTTPALRALAEPKEDRTDV